MIGRFVGQPLDDAEPFQALGDELQAALVAGQLMHPGDGADLVKIVGTGLFRAVGLDQNQADDPLFAAGGGLDGGQPRLFVEQQRQRLGREERPFGQRQQIQGVGQNVGGRNDGVIGGGRGAVVVLAHDFRFEGFGFVVGHDLSAAKGIPP